MTDFSAGSGNGVLPVSCTRLARDGLSRLILGPALVAALTLIPVRYAHADSLFQSMASAYVTNPSLNAARAGQRATDELVPRALSGWRPSVTVQGNVQAEWGSTNAITVEHSSGHYHEETGDSANLEIALKQPIFQGFHTIASTRAAQAQVEGGRQELLQTEQQVLFDVIQSYMNVYAGRQMVALRKQDIRALEDQLVAARRRVAYGEITRTDVAQSEARLAEARNALIRAQTQLAQDIASYIQSVGYEPAALTYPKVVNVPSSLNAALRIAGEINPRLLAQAFVEVAAKNSIAIARSDLLPNANLRARALTADSNIGTDDTGLQSASVAAEFSMPIYEAGLAYSQVRQAKQRASQARIEVISVARDVRSAVAQSWNAYLGLGQVIKNTKVQIRAAQLALDGVQQEYRVGTRTTLDVLDAQRELVQSQALEVEAEKARVVAGYQLLAAMGRLTAKDLGLDVPIYDAEANYRRVRGKWIGTGVKTVD